MNVIEFEDVSFGFEQTPVFSHLNLEIPQGITSLTGPNGAGKSTLLLLGSGRILPQSGTVRLMGTDTRDLDERARGLLASLVFQNMEFETDEILGSLLEFVFQSGQLPSQEHHLVDTVIREFELMPLLDRKTQTLSKGEMQRAVMAFSLLYGSRVVVMDEPIFALEDAQKQRSLEFLSSQARARGLSFIYSVHELELTKAYSDQVLLFSKGGRVQRGSAETLLTRQNLEDAYQVPYVLLHQKERLYRSSLLGTKTLSETGEATKENGHQGGDR